MTTNIETYFIEGCGRCPLGGTPECKVHNWKKELQLLRRILNDCHLKEEIKWGVPCYTFQGHNLLILAALKEYCSISFFKGALLQDTDELLVKPGENTQSARLIKITDVQEIVEKETMLKTYIYEAIEVEKAGIKVEYKKLPEPVPEEFQNVLDTNPDIQTAFEALTPGRQRGYILYFSAPKQSKTRASRIEKYIPSILNGKGFHDQ